MKREIRAIVVDDEPNSRDILAHLLRLDGNVTLLAKCRDLKEAMEAIRVHKPDMVFLDIEMPGGSGFELLEQLNKADFNPAVVFITAYNQYAIKAIKYSAFDYLLKPIDIDDLNQTIQRYREDFENQRMKSKVDSNPLQTPDFQKLKFSMRNGVVFIDPDDIVWFEASGSYTILHFQARKDEVVSVSLKDVEGQLEGLPFFRISRSAIINLKYLSRIDRRNKICIIQKSDKIFEVQGTPAQLKILESK
ncbi:MAG: LytR/AlgR family response regulator transcription factor [Bacteroidales bacterium]